MECLLEMQISESHTRKAETALGLNLASGVLLTHPGEVLLPHLDPQSLSSRGQKGDGV